MVEFEVEGDLRVVDMHIKVLITDGIKIYVSGVSIYVQVLSDIRLGPDNSLGTDLTIHVIHP